MLRTGLVALCIAALTACYCGDEADLGEWDGDDWSGQDWGNDDVGGSYDSWQFEQALDAILVQVANGSIDVANTDGPAIVEWDGGGFGDAASPDVYVEDGILYVDADSGVAGGGGEVIVWLPPGVGTGNWIEYGEITINLDERSDIVACAVGGEVRIDVPSGRWNLQLETPAGDTRVDGVDDDPDSPWRIGSRVIAGSLQIVGH